MWFGEGQPTEPPTTPDEPTDDSTSEDPTDGPTTGGPTGVACEATATVNDWGSGAGVTVTVANTGTQNINNWMLHWSWPRSGTAISQIWNAEHSVMGGVEMAEPVSWNQSIAVDGSVQFGFNVSGAIGGTPEFDCLPS